MKNSCTSLYQQQAVQNVILGEFPGGPVIRTLHFHCQGLCSIPGQGTKIPQATQPKTKKYVIFLKTYAITTEIKHIRHIGINLTKDIYRLIWRISYRK